MILEEEVSISVTNDKEHNVDEIQTSSTFLTRKRCLVEIEIETLFVWRELTVHRIVLMSVRW